MKIRIFSTSCHTSPNVQIMGLIYTIIGTCSHNCCTRVHMVLSHSARCEKMIQQKMSGLTDKNLILFVLFLSFSIFGKRTVPSVSSDQNQKMSAELVIRTDQCLGSAAGGVLQGIQGMVIHMQAHQVTAVRRIDF